MIIDCHTHLNNYNDETSATLEDDLARLQATMRRCRVDVALVLTSYKQTPGRPSARAVVEATKHLPNIHVVAGISWSTFDEAQAAELRSLLEQKAIKGLKLYPGYEPFYPSDPKLTPAYQLAEEFDVPVMIHTGDTYAPSGKVKFAHPLHVDEVAVDFPRVKFLICHLGNPWFRDCMEVVYKNSNVYTDISGLTLGQFTDRFEEYMRQQLKEMILWGVNPNRVLYGTDWPLASMESYLDFMEELTLPAADKDLMFFGNAAALFKLEIPHKPMGLGSFLNRL